MNNLHSRLLGTYLAAPAANITSSQLVFHQFHQNDLEGLLRTLVDFYLEDENNLGRVVDIAIDIQVS